MSCSFARKKDDIETLRKLLCWPEAEVAVPTADAAGGSEEAHGLAITAVEREGDPHPLAVVAADLKAVGAPQRITRTQPPKQPQEAFGSSREHKICNRDSNLRRSGEVLQRSTAAA
jgi:hypothetical protein